MTSWLCFQAISAHPIIVRTNQCTAALHCVNADYYLADAIRDLERSWEIAPAAGSDTGAFYSGSSSNSGATAGAALGSKHNQSSTAAAPPHHAKLRGSVYILLNVLANADNEMVSQCNHALYTL